MSFAPSSRDNQNPLEANGFWLSYVPPGKIHE
jgi:hypothetical protein